ncbi:hypothetical protein PINS_up023230 [Pythium insidiosum]|nr:hypothetical protein PINS_up023230 [Pythium insidiosum]
MLTCDTSASDSLAAALDAVDPRYVANVAIRHCDGIVIPRVFQSLTHIVGIKTYNTSIAAWPEDAALTQETHPDIRFALFLRTNFSGGVLPIGLHTAPFPPRLVDVEIVSSNLRELPTDLDAVWHTGMNLFFELCREMRRISPVLARLQPLVISMAGSPVEELPIALLESPNLYVLSLRNTSISVIDDDWDTSASLLVSLCLEYSRLEKIPRWVTPAFRKRTSVLGEGNTVVRAQRVDHARQLHTPRTGSHDVLPARH